MKMCAVDGGTVCQCEIQCIYGSETYIKDCERDGGDPCDCIRMYTSSGLQDAAPSSETIEEETVQEEPVQEETDTSNDDNGDIAPSSVTIQTAMNRESYWTKSGLGKAAGAFTQRTNVRGALIAGVALLLGLVAIIWALLYRNKVNRSSKPAKLNRAKKR